MKFKIQVPAGAGWADLKATEDGETYGPDLYEREADAVAEGLEIRACIGDFEFRVVPEDHPSDCDLY